MQMSRSYRRKHVLGLVIGWLLKPYSGKSTNDLDGDPPCYHVRNIKLCQSCVHTGPGFEPL